MQQQNMGAPSTIGGLGNLSTSIPAPVAPRQAAVAPSAIVPTSTTSMASTSSRALATSSNNGGSSDEDGNLGEDDTQKKKERRRQQVRYASRRRRKKQKDEESFLRDRIAELKEQIRIIGGDLTEQCSQMAGMSEQALTEAYEKQMVTVQTLRKDNNKLKEQLLQHENFARMIQYGLNALPSDCRDVDRKKIAGVPMWISDQMNPLKGPTLVVDLNLCHEAVRHAYNELKTFGPTVNSKTNVCYAMGWKTELWAASTCLNFRAVRSISDKNIREVADASWEIITSPDKFKRIYPDVKQFRILQKVTDDIVVVHRIASVASDLSDREFISVAFRFRDGDNYFIGIKSITVQTEAAENCIRGEECQGWMFVGGENETSQWKAHFLGYYDVKGEKDDKVLNQLANEAMFGMLRWESEAMHPLSQQHYGTQDMMFDPLPMNNGLYHPPPPIHQQHGGMGGLMQQQGMVAPEDDPRFVDDLLGALGNDPAGLGGQQQQQHLGQMPSHVYDQHMMPQHSQAPNFQPGRTQGMPMTSQAPLMQQGGMPAPCT
ncbi:START-like domain [Phytophthora cactorum]|nr:START-like domain [Phytophthora cactorum]